jgi:3-oxoacyl-[acyl-carrier protein] reductase
MDLGLVNKIALITGSTKGLGFATVQVLLEEGAKVMINSRHQENIDTAIELLMNEKCNHNLNGIAGDVTDEEACRIIVEKIVGDFGGLDILITNSGGPPPGFFIELSTEQWREAIDLSFMSHLNLIKNSLPFLLKSQSSSVLAVTSFTIKNPLNNLILSNTVRAATASLIKSLSLELGKQGIRFNSILPGWTRTERVDELLLKRSQLNETSIEDEFDLISRTIPLGRMGSPREFAKVAAFLVSPTASYINGVMLNVDGGINKSLF